MHVGAAYRTLRNIVENPAQAPLHDSAVRAIGLIDSSPAVRYLLQLLANPTRQALGVCGAAYSKSPKLVPALEKLITNSSPATQIDAIYALGDIGGDSAARMLLKHLDGPHRWRVIDTLGTARSGVAVPRLSELLRSRDLRKQERDAVAEALSQIDTPEARQVLATTLARGRKKAASSAGSALSARRQY